MSAWQSEKMAKSAQRVQVEARQQLSLVGYNTKTFIKPTEN